jgi:hypothetical protein
MDEEDAIIWQFNSSGIRDRGVRQIYTPVMWKITTPSRLHIFLWLQAKRRALDDMTCLFCTEKESVKHLFFDCCVAQVLWENISEIIGVAVGTDFESVAKWWLIKKYNAVNACTCTAAALWALWKIRNDLCFQGVKWTLVHRLPRKSAKMLRDWCLLNKPEDAGKLEEWAKVLERRSSLPPRLTWELALGSSVSTASMWCVS